MTIWFTSDPHWGHEFVAKIRGFESADDHDAHLHRVYAESFEPGDVVYWLGDLTLRMKPAEAAIRCVATAPAAQHRLIYGNHDAGHPLHKNTHKHRLAYTSFALAEPFAKLNLEGTEVRLSHFPYEGDHGEDRYGEWRLKDAGVPLLHGHTHGKEQVSYTKAWTVQVHVGWDAWERPVTSHELATLVREASAARPRLKLQARIDEAYSRMGAP